MSADLLRVVPDGYVLNTARSGDEAYPGGVNARSDVRVQLFTRGKRVADMLATQIEVTVWPEPGAVSPCTESKASMKLEVPGFRAEYFDGWWSVGLGEVAWDPRYVHSVTLHSDDGTAAVRGPKEVSIDNLVVIAKSALVG